MIELVRIKRTEPRILEEMSRHYSRPKGFVGRNICYGVYYGGVRYGSVVGGSATLHLPGRDEFFGKAPLNSLVNNIFYHIEKVGGEYPIRNFTVAVIHKFCETVAKDWKEKYGDDVVGFESLVELPRTGELYKRAGWELVGQTKGYTCKRVGGEGTDSWTGKRVWNTEELKPKLVFCKRASEEGF